MAKKSGQKHIAQNQAPRVQIEYDVELYGSEEKKNLPFVMGVLADLSGNPSEPLPAVADREFLEVTAENFDRSLKSCKPRVVLNVDNTLSRDGSELNVELNFESMDDFTPAAIARKVEPLKKLLEDRTRLKNLITYMDGKSSAEQSLDELLQNIKNESPAGKED
ncbi:MAG: type VI secretion system contractile sheath small subunit [Verrucomicrobiota bacterium]